MKFKKVSAGVLALALSVGAVAPAISSFVPTSYASSEEVEAKEESKASVADHKTTVNIYKTYKTSKIEGNEIENKRGVKPDKLPEGLNYYNEEAQNKFGKVGFTLYQIQDNDGNPVMLTSTDEEPLELKDENISIENMTVKLGNDTYKLAEYKPETEVDKDGLAKFEDIPNGTYIAIETKSNKQLIKQVATSMLISLPMANDNGDGLKPSIDLIPKNEVDETEFELTKYLDKKGSTLDGVKFAIYKGTPGKGEKIGERETKNGGKITLEDLVLGQYYFVEESTGKENVDVSYYARNDEYNTLTFEIGELGVENYNAELMNYTKPDAKKEINDGRSNDTNFKHGFNRGDLVPFKTTIKVPEDVAGEIKEKQAGVEYTRRPAGRMVYKDVPDESLLADEVEPVLKSGDIELVKDEDYTVTLLKEDEENKDRVTGFLIDFVIKDAKWKATEDDEGIDIKKVSDKVAGLAGKEITVSYKMKLSQEAPLDTDIKNHMEFRYNSHPSLDTEYDFVKKDEKIVQTYGKVFVKTSTKAKGLLEDKKSRVKGAEFVVWRDKDGYVVTEDADPETVAERTNKDLGGRQYLIADKENPNKIKWSETIKANEEGEFEIPENARKITSGENGVFKVEGLEEGTYYLKETKAPKGYVINDEDQEFKIESESFSETDELKIQHVVNKRDNDLRNTGYAITGIAIGIAGVVAASVVTIKKMKNKEEIVIEDK